MNVIKALCKKQWYIQNKWIALSVCSTAVNFVQGHPFDHVPVFVCLNIS